MKFGEKLRELTKGRRRAEIARSANVKPSVLNNYINRGSEPMAFAAYRLAKALAVPLEWLLDDAADYPPPVERRPIPGSLTAFSYFIAKMIEAGLIDLEKGIFIVNGEELDPAKRVEIDREVARMSEKDRIANLKR